MKGVILLVTLSAVVTWAGADLSVAASRASNPFGSEADGCLPYSPDGSAAVKTNLSGEPLVTAFNIPKPLLKGEVAAAG